jgi:hypothetical protein
MSDTKGITPDKAKRRSGTWQPSPVKKSAASTAPNKKMNYRPQGR